MNLNDRKELLAAIEGLAYAMKHDLRVDDRIKFGQHREELIETLGDEQLRAVKIDNNAVYAANKQHRAVIDRLNSEIEQLSDTEDNLHLVCQDYDKHVVELDIEIKHLRTINSSMHERLAAHAADRLDLKYFIENKGEQA